MTRQRSIRRRTALACGVAAGLLASLLAVASPPVPAAAEEQPTPPPPPGVNGRVTVSLPSEPEYLLVAGQAQWNVRNRPHGTLVAGYGRPRPVDEQGQPAGGVHDTYMATARYPDLGTSPDRRLLDVGFIDRRGDGTRASAWYFGRYDDGTAEVWGPADDGVDERYVLAHSEGIVGGMVHSTSGGEPISLAVLGDGTLAEFRGSEFRELVPLPGGGPPHRIGESPRAAVGRSFRADGGTPMRVTSTSKPFFDPDAPHTSRQVEEEQPQGEDLLVVLLDNGDLVPIYLDPDDLGGLTIGAPLSSFFGPAPSPGQPDGKVPARLPDPVTLDADVSCVEYALTEHHEEAAEGAIAEQLGCDAPAAPGMSLGRISVAVGVPDGGHDANSPSVTVVTAADVVEGLRIGRPASCLPDGFDCTYASSIELREDVGCRYGPLRPYRQLPGSFDLQVAVASTHLGCVEAGAGVVRLDSYHQPAVAAVERVTLNSGAEPVAPDRSAVTTSQTFAPERVTYERLAQPGPHESSPADPTIVDTYDINVLDQPSVQLSFPCQRLLLRELANGGTMDDCDLSTPFETFPLGAEDPAPPAPPTSWVSATVAGYGSVAGDRQLYVSNQPIAGFPDDPLYWNDEEAEEQLPGPQVAANYAWTVEPSPYLATDLQAVRETPLETDVDSFDAYQPPAVGAGGPGPFLAEVRRPTTTDVVVELTSHEPRRETTDSAPLAVLQAPPIVAGLGQQTDFTPEFGISSSTGSSTETSRSTRVGTHVGIEATATVGAGALGNHAVAGGGVAFDYQFMREVEETIGHSVEVETSEGYGGSFGDHTVVVRSLQRWVWDAEVVEDPTGLATGDAFEYAIPIQEITRAVPLSQLARTEPGLYGEGTGALRKSIDRIVAGSVPGDVTTYLKGADLPQPDTVLATNGGPCKGGFTAPGTPTSFEGDLAPALRPHNNPYFLADPEPPTGPNIVTSAVHEVQLGNELTEGATITISEATERSLLSVESHDFAVTGIFQVSAKVNLGVTATWEFEAQFGVDRGFSTGAGITDTLSHGTSLSTVMGNIPHQPPASDEDGPPHWLNQETYNWRMFMCKAQLGPMGLLSDIWVQGYVVDDVKENASGGIDELADVSLAGPVDSTVVLASADAQPPSSIVVPECAAGSSGLNGFRFDHPAGTSRRYVLEIENLTSGGQAEREVDLGIDDTDVDDPVGPADFNQGWSTDRPDCALIEPATLRDGDLYRWRTVVDGWLDDKVQSDWEFFRPQVWPPDHTLTMREPIIHQDGSATIELEPIAGVSSLRHDVTVRPRGGGEAVAERSGVRTSFRTPELPPGEYVVEAVGYNDHELAEGQRAETEPATALFTVDERLRSQYSWDCTADICKAGERVRFSDESLTARNVPIVEWEWDFGDGTTSTEQHPVHRYESVAPDDADGYDVRLRVWDTSGTSSTRYQRVQVDPLDVDPPTADFTHTTCDEGGAGTCAAPGEEVAFDPSATTAPELSVIEAWEWDFGDGTTRSVTDPTESVTGHAYDAPGTYLVQLRVLDQYGQWSEPTAQRIVVHIDPPTASFTHTACDAGQGDDDGCPTTGAPVTFDPSASTAVDGSTITRWQWDFGDGTVVEVDDPAQAVVEHAYERPGDHRVELRLADQYGQWSQPASQVIGIGNRPATVTLTSDHEGGAFEDEPATFTAVVEDPDGDPGAAQVSWRFDGGDPVEGHSATHTWTTPGSGTVEVTVVDEGGATTETNLDVRVLAGPVADLAWSCPFFGRCNTFSKTAFEDRSTDEQAPIVSWQWDLGDGTTSTEQHPKHRYKKAGTYAVTLTITDARGKQATQTREVSIRYL